MNLREPSLFSKIELIDRLSVHPTCLIQRQLFPMIELSNTFWYILWTVMGCAFLCAWVFIVVGCHKMDADGQRASEPHASDQE